ncbi:MAG: MaoC/PaaZ C-terminal domain-containing protein [Actinomycetota bacterium]
MRPRDAGPGDPIASFERTVERGDLVTYAELSGDRNPLHQDDAAARAAGFDRVIAHGMFTMAHLAACLDRWLDGEGDVARLSAQFRSPVSVGETIVAGGRVRSVDHEAGTLTAELWVTVERDGATEHAVRKGEAEIRLRQSAS